VYHVYVIVSENAPERYYIGFSSRPHERLQEHNSGKNPSTIAYLPWRFAAIFSFPSEQQHAYSSDILKVVQAGRFFGVMCLIHSW
jgi:predicted GIY-YIG superfamily endonuclease